MAEDIITVQNLRGDALARCTAWLATRDELVAEAAGVESVETDDALTAAGQLLTRLKRHAKELEGERKAVTQPLDDVKRQIMDQEKTMVADIDRETRRVKGLCDAYATRRAREAEAARIEAQRRAAEEAVRREAAAAVFGESAVIQAPAPSPVAPPPAPPKAAGSRMVTRYEFEVVAPALVPREFCVPDPKAIRAWMEFQVKTGRTPDMPGVRFTSRMSVESRG